MPTTVTATNGTDYPLWQGRCLVKDLDEGLSFDEFRNELGGNFRSQLLFGSTVGNKDWNIAMPTIQGSTLSPSVAGIFGGTTTYEKYVYELYWHVKRTGQPFVYQCPRTSQYYFAEFADERLSFQRMLTKLYSSTLRIKQVRIPGVSVFNPGVVSELWAWYNPNAFTGTTWPDSTGNGNNIPTVTGDVQHVANAKNGNRVVRLNASSDTGYLSSALDVTAYDIIALIQIREDTFSNFGGIVTGDNFTSYALVGDENETRFFYFAAIEPYRYWKNNIEYGPTDMQAPMNAYGIVHVRYQNGTPLVNLRLGRDRDYTGRNAKVDYGDVMISDEPIPLNIVAEIVEYLASKWKVNVN